MNATKTNRANAAKYAVTREAAIEQCRASTGRCACNARGTWAEPVYGTVGSEGHVWAGCSYHPNAVGHGVSRATFDRAIGRIDSLIRIGELLDGCA